MWYTPIAVGAVVVVGLIVSYLTRPLKPGEVDPKLIIHVGDVCCCCLPKRFRSWFPRAPPPEKEVSASD